MHYAIIAAGEGSRLASEGVSAPKPLIEVNGMPMIERLLLIFARYKAESISVIVNASMPEVQDFLTRWASAERLQSLGIGKFRLIVDSTPSSLHSFYSLSKVIDADAVCLTTVDTIFRQEHFARFVSIAEHLPDTKDGCFAITPFVDDEKPLYVEAGSNIEGFYDDGDHPYVSGGIYYLKTSKAFPVLRQCVESGTSRMRNFQRALIRAGLLIEPCVFPVILDIDHASDIGLAESYLRSTSILFVSRAASYSPNNENNDRRILDLTLSKCRSLAREVSFATVSECELSNIDLRKYSVIVGMERSREALTRLDSCGALVLNHPEGISKASRRICTLRLLEQAGICVPPYWAHQYADGPLLFGHISADHTLFPGWVKLVRDGGCFEGDVQYAGTFDEAKRVIEHQPAESLQEVVVTRHIHGDLIKVYAVVDSQSSLQFFRWFYPQECGYTKFGNEKHNDALSHFTFDESELRTTVVSIAEVLNLQFFGVDFIIGQDLKPIVIDVNDWPSYSVCQDEAAEAIARTIFSNVETR